MFAASVNDFVCQKGSSLWHSGASVAFKTVAIHSNVKSFFFSFFARVYLFARNMSVCCVTLNVLFTTVFSPCIRSFIVVSLFLTARVVLYGGWDILIIYSRHWWGVYHEGVAIWQRCWTSVHYVTFCYVSFSMCFTSCYVAFSLSRFVCFFFLRWTGCLCTRFIAPRICTYPSQHYVTLVLGKESDMFSLYSSWSVAINFVYWEVSYVLHRFPPCKKSGNMCRTWLRTQMLL